ncbi:MAG: hypothetical protein ACRC6M_17900, partial [Microcystaceae cyanobacterium]
PLNKKKKKLNKTVTSEVETKPDGVLASENTAEKQESSLKSETHSSKQTSNPKKSAKKTNVQAVINTEITEIKKKPLDSSDSLPLEPSPSQPSVSASFFQAIGFIQGVIVSGEDGRIAIQIGSNVYKLYAKPKLLKKLEIGKEFLLRVYPSITNGKQVFGFKALCIYTGNPEQTIKPEDAIPNIFTLKGIWQFYSKSEDTVITVFRNQKRYPQDLCKPTHIPLSWENYEVAPFRFNPNLTKDDKKADRYFVEIQAQFLPEQGLFAFDSLLAKPTKKIPKHLKEIKTAQKTKKEQPINPSNTDSETKPLPENTLEEKPPVLAETISTQIEDPLGVEPR